MKTIPWATKLSLAGLVAATALAVLPMATATARAADQPPPAGEFAGLLPPIPGGGPFAGDFCRDGGERPPMALLLFPPPFLQGEPRPADREEPAGLEERDDPQARLALRLAALEIVAGIRADQLDAWRDYTDALLALLQPPAPPPPGKDGDAADADPFARAERLARDQVARGEEAAALEQAIQVLRGKLTPEQLERIQAFESREAPSRR